MSTNLIIKRIITDLFVAEERRLNQTIVNLNQRNKFLIKSKYDGFIYNGKFYIPKECQGQGRVSGHSRNTLHETLNGEMEYYVKDEKLIETDKSYISQSLYKLLSPCLSLQEYRNALPECLVCCVSELTAYERILPEAYTIHGDERAMRQYEKIYPKMAVYSASRLLY